MTADLEKFKSEYESSMALDVIDAGMRTTVVQSLTDILRSKTQPVKTVDVTLALTCVRILSRGKASINVSSSSVYSVSEACMFQSKLEYLVLCQCASAVAYTLCSLLLPVLSFVSYEPPLFT